jgi:ketosteroid isomerase-like protein
VVTVKRVMRMVCVLPAVSVLAIAACSGPKEQQFVQDDANKIRQRAKDLQEAINAKDAAKVVPFYTAESVLMPPNAPTVRGKEPIQAFYVDLYGQGATDLQLETKDVRGHGPLAYETGAYSLNRRPASGTSTRDRSGESGQLRIADCGLQIVLSIVDWRLLIYCRLGVSLRSTLISRANWRNRQ